MARQRDRSRSRSRGDSSRSLSRRAALITGGGLLVSAGAYASGAFDSLTGERPLQIATSSDATALLGVSERPQAGTSGATVPIFEVTNRFDDPIQFISVRLLNPTGAPVDPGSLSTPTALGPGESGLITAELSCSTSNSQPLQLQIDAATGTESVTLSRRVSVSCEPPAQGVCDRRELTGCVDNRDRFPRGRYPPPQASESCHLRVETTGEVSATAAGDFLPEHHVVVQAGEIELDVTGQAALAESLRLESTGELDITVGANASIGGVLQVDSGGEVTVDIDPSQRLAIGGLCGKTTSSFAASLEGTDVGGAIDVTASGETDLTVQESTQVDGPVAVAGTETTVTVDGGSSIAGDTAITGDGETDVSLVNADIGGQLTTESPNAVAVDATTTRVAGVTIDSDAETDLTLGSSTITGSASVTGDGETTVTLTNTSVAGALPVTGASATTVSLTGSSADSLTVESGGETGVTVSGTDVAGDLIITGGGETDVTIDSQSTIDGDVTIADVGEVSVEIESGTTVRGDLTVQNASSVELTGCQYVDGSVDPAGQCEEN